MYTFEENEAYCVEVLVSTGDGNDQLYVDDNSSITTIDTGTGDDFIQVGQVFGYSRIPVTCVPEEPFLVSIENDHK